MNAGTAPDRPWGEKRKGPVWVGMPVPKPSLVAGPGDDLRDTEKAGAQGVAHGRCSTCFQEKGRSPGGGASASCFTRSRPGEARSRAGSPQTLPRQRSQNPAHAHRGLPSHLAMVPGPSSLAALRPGTWENGGFARARPNSWAAGKAPQLCSSRRPGEQGPGPSQEEAWELGPLRPALQKWG